MDGPNARFAVGNSVVIMLDLIMATNLKSFDNFKVKANGEVTVSVSLIDGAARIQIWQIGGIPDGNVVFFDDFTTYASVNNVLQHLMTQKWMERCWLLSICK